MNEFFALPIAFQVALGGGFLGYMLASAGLRRGHTAIDVTMRTIAFGLPAMAIFVSFNEERGAVLAGFGGVAGSIFVAALWRGVLSDLTIKLIKLLQIHQDEFRTSAWDTLLQSPGLEVTQVMVRLKSGRELFLANPEPYINGPLKGLILGVEGDVVMVVESEEFPDQEAIERTAVLDERYGTRLTYIPAREIETIDLRCK